jgi:hypothetical protein
VTIFLVNQLFVLQSNCMDTAREAAEQLRMIRNLMERATIFRALTGETALVGGALACLAAWASEKKMGLAWAQFWLIGLAFVIGFYIFQMWRIARAKDGGKIWNQSLKLVLRCALPSLLAGGITGLLIAKGAQQGHRELAACFWITHYGIALLAIREFVPKSMVWLGWAFVIFGVVALCTFMTSDIAFQVMHKLNGSRLMALSFGGLHLLYGALIVTTNQRESAND